MDDKTINETESMLLGNLQTSKEDDMWSYGKIMHIIQTPRYHRKGSRSKPSLLWDGLRTTDIISSSGDQGTLHELNRM